MSKQKVNPSRFRWLILTTILAVAVISVAIAFWTGIFFPRKVVEKIYFGSCEWSEDPSSGDITEVNLLIANTGADELIVNKVWINETLLDSTEWESFPSMRFQPGDQGVLQITPSLIIFKEGTSYQFTIQTVSGNSFSYTATAESQTFPFMKTEELKIIALTWGANNVNATFTVKNSGTAALRISSVKVNDASATMSPSSVTLQPGEQTTIIVNLISGFTSGTKYEFAFYSATGNRYPYTSTAP